MYYHTGWSGRASHKMTFEPIPERVTETCEQWWNNVLTEETASTKAQRWEWTVTFRKQ